MKRTAFLLIIILTLSISRAADAQDQTSLLIDKNGDGKVAVTCFGDSITFGVGDNGLLPDAARKGGWPDRTELLVGVPFDNEGIPGEELTGMGYLRFVPLLQSKDSDLVLIFEGANDAYRAVSSISYRDSLQRVVNVARTLGKEPVLMTLPTPCCNHSAQVAATNRYTDEIKLLALANDLQFVDIKKAWDTTCTERSQCELYNLPEGLHPTARGYDVISQVTAATLLGIDIFAVDGAAQLESALGLPAGTVIVKPEIISAETPA